MKYQEEESLLIDMICESNEEVRNSLYESYKPLIYYVVKKYVTTAKKLGLEYNDLLQEANVGFTDAINTYDEKKDASLKTFMQVCIGRRLSNYIEKNKTIKNKIIQESLSLDYDYDKNGLPLKDILADENKDPLKTFSDKENYERIRKRIKAMLSESEKLVFNYMLQGLNYTEISKKLDKSPKQIDNTMQRIRIKIKELLKEE